MLLEQRDVRENAYPARENAYLLWEVDLLTVQGKTTQWQGLVSRMLELTSKIRNVE